MLTIKKRIWLTIRIAPAGPITEQVVGDTGARKPESTMRKKVDRYLPHVPEPNEVVGGTT